MKFTSKNFALWFVMKGVSGVTDKYTDVGLKKRWVMRI